MMGLLGTAALLVLAKVALNLARYLAVRRWRSRPPALHDGRGGPIPVLILVPLLREEALAEQIVATWRRATDAYGGDATVLLICSARERAGGRSPTHDALARALRVAGAPARIKLVETDGSDRCKADQLRCGLSAHLCDRPRRDGDPALLIGVYDADSIPAAGTLAEVAGRYCAGQGRVRAFQQPPLYAGRLERFLRRGRLSAAFCLSRALYSHKFSYKESFGYLLSGGPADLRLSHFTGHGYFIERGLLEECGGFRAPSCDTTLGYQLSLRGERIELLRGYDLAEVPEDVGDLFRQGVVWFNGCELYPRELRDLPWGRGAPLHLLASKVLGVFATNLSWSVLPLLWTALLLGAVIASGPLRLWAAAIGAWLALHALLWVDLLHLSRGRRPSLPAALLVLPVLLSPLSVLCGCLPPLHYYACRALRRPLGLRKTLRPADSGPRSGPRERPGGERAAGYGVAAEGGGP